MCASGPSTNPTLPLLLILSGPCRVYFHTSLPPGGNLLFFPPGFSFCPGVVSHAHKEIMQVSQGVPLSHTKMLGKLGLCERQVLREEASHGAQLLRSPHYAPSHSSAPASFLLGLAESLKNVLGLRSGMIWPLLH